MGRYAEKSHFETSNSELILLSVRALAPNQQEIPKIEW